MLQFAWVSRFIYLEGNMLYKRILMIVLIMVSGVIVVGCEKSSQATTLLTTTQFTTTEPTTTVNPYFDLFFDFEPDTSKTDEDLAQTLTDLTTLMEPYDLSQFNDTITYYEDKYAIANVTDLDPDQYSDHYLYPEDVLEVNAFETQYSQSTLFYEDIRYLVSLLDQPDLSLGEAQSYQGTYDAYVCCQGLGKYYTEITADVNVYVLLADGALYADIWRFQDSGSLANRSVYSISYDSSGIISLQKFGFDSLPDKPSVEDQYESIDYNRDGNGTFLKVLQNRSHTDNLTLKYTDSNGNITSYIYNKNSIFPLSTTKSNFEEEYVFWTYYEDDIDYRHLDLYDNGLFQIGYNLFKNTDTSDYVGSNNILTYNLKYVDGWDYFFAGSLYKDDIQLPTRNHVSGVRIFPLSPELTQTVVFEIDSTITQNIYENPLNQFHYDYIAYQDFMNIWNSFSNVWDDYYLSNTHLYIGDLNVNLYLGGKPLIELLSSGSSTIFYDEIALQYPDIMYS